MHKLKNKKYIVVMVLLVVLLGLTLAYVLIKDTAAPSDDNKSIPTTGGASVNETKGVSVANDEPGYKNSSGNVGVPNLLTPSGTFVSNHRPNIDGSPAPSKVSSTCNTTPGAKCTIIFSKDGVTKSLPAKITDQEGSAYWEWDISDLDLTTGSWKITASANLNSQTKTASDSLDLVVSP